jgi:RNA polymerase-binding transcription factor DksA
MTTMRPDTSRARARRFTPDLVARLRLELLRDRVAQAALSTEHLATATALTGQTDVDSILERELADASAARARDAIQEIDAALERIGTNVYGMCESCGVAIPAARLEAIPHARFCVACPVQPSPFLA